MKTRIISALVGTVLLIGILFCPYEWVFVGAMAALAAIATWELLHNTGIMKNLAVCIVSMLFSALAVLGVGAAESVVAMARPYYPLPADALVPLIVGLLAAYIVFMLIAWLVCRKVLSLVTFVKALLLTAYATLGFAALACLRLSPSVFGLPFVMLPLVIAWMSDTGAYFVGTFLGKHKMAPVISPKKSWEGFFGGWLISIGLTAVFGVICNVFIGGTSSLHIKVGLITVFAALLAPLSVLGDLFASLIKRRCGIKDYGNIMPGHGGVMDRFDSVIFIAPLLWLLLELFH